MGHTDHKVPYLTENSLAALAHKYRKLARPIGRFTVDITDLIARVLRERFLDTVGLAIVRFEGDVYDDQAYVVFREQYPRVVLHVRRKVWEDAQKGLSYAYFILAHELAHIVCHDHRAVAYTRDPSLRIRNASNETSAEWQADTFAKHFTMPDQALRQTTDPYQLSIYCNIDLGIAEERVKSYGRTGPMYLPKYEGDPCGECSNFTIVRDGTSTRCDTCGRRCDERTLAAG
jgi:Zn-dependent peptidase ImmA (M78 family)